MVDNLTIVKKEEEEDLRSLGLSKRSFKVFSVTVSSLSSTSEASNYIPAAPIFLPEGPWQQIPGEVTAAKGFKAAGMYGGLRAKGEKPELALVGCDVDATVAAISATTSACHVNVLHRKKARNQASDRILIILLAYDA
ncbi:hypothetical protein Peur_070027 [Populus x canadensis]